MDNLEKKEGLENEMYYLNQAEKALREGDEQSCVNWFYEGLKNTFSEKERNEIQKLILSIM